MSDKKADRRSPKKGEVQAVVGLLDGQEHRFYVNVSRGAANEGRAWSGHAVSHAGH